MKAGDQLEVDQAIVKVLDDLGHEFDLQWKAEMLGGATSLRGVDSTACTLEAKGYMTILVPPKGTAQDLLAHEAGHFTRWLRDSFPIPANGPSSANAVSYSVNTISGLLEDVAVYPLVSVWGYKAITKSYVDSYNIKGKPANFSFRTKRQNAAEGTDPWIKSLEIAHAKLLVAGPKLGGEQVLSSSQRNTIWNGIRCLERKYEHLFPHVAEIMALLDKHDLLSGAGCASIMESIFTKCGLRDKVELLPWREYVERYSK